jgi:hypothetical protein
VLLEEEELDTEWLVDEDELEEDELSAALSDAGIDDSTIIIASSPTTLRFDARGVVISSAGAGDSVGGRLLELLSPPLLEVRFRDAVEGSGVCTMPSTVLVVRTMRGDGVNFPTNFLFQRCSLSSFAAAFLN